MTGSLRLLQKHSFFHLDMKERTKERVKAVEKMPEIFAHFAEQNETCRLRRLRTTFCPRRSVRFDFRAAFFQRPIICFHEYPPLTT